MINEIMYDDRFWITILIVLVFIFIIGIQLAIIAIVLWIIFLWWNKNKHRIPPLDK